MKLVLVISSLATGGAERVLTTLANAWSKRGWQITLVTTHDDGSPPFYPVDSAIKLCTILLSDVSGGGPLANFKRVRKLRGIFKEEAPDVVVSFLNYTNILVLMAGMGLNFPILVSERLDPRVHQLPPVWATLRRVLYPQARILVNQTEAAAAFFRPWLGDKVHIVPNPVIEPGQSAGPPELTLPPRSIVAMGRLHPQKGFDTLLLAMARVHEVFPDWSLTVLGEGPLRKELEELRDQLGLSGVVNFPGRVKRPDLVLSQGELFVLSSVTEGFPNVLCEAMVAGLPVVSTDCPSGPSEIVRQDETGFLVPVGDPAEMANAISKLLTNENLRKRLGHQGCDIVDEYSLARVLGDWDQVFQKVNLVI